MSWHGAASHEGPVLDSNSFSMARAFTLSCFIIFYRSGRFPRRINKLR